MWVVGSMCMRLVTAFQPCGYETDQLILQTTSAAVIYCCLPAVGGDSFPASSAAGRHSGQTLL